MLKEIPLLMILSLLVGCAAHVTPEYWAEKGDTHWKRGETGAACYSYRAAQMLGDAPLSQFSNRCLPLREQAATECLEVSALFCSGRITDKSDERLESCFLAQSIDYENPEVHNAIGRYLWKAGEKQGACKAFSIAAEYGNSSELDHYCK